MATFYPAFEPQRCFASPEAAEQARAAKRESRRQARLALAPTRNDHNPALLDQVVSPAERRWGERRRVKLAVRDARTKAFIDPGERQLLEKLGFSVDATARARKSVAKHALGQFVGAALEAAEADAAKRAARREVKERRQRVKARKARRAKARRAEKRKAKRHEERPARREPVDRPRTDPMDAHGSPRLVRRGHHLVLRGRVDPRIQAQVDAYIGGQHRRLMA